MEARALLSSLASEQPRFVRFARLRVATDADGEDIVQRALLRAAAGAGSLEDPALARAWFYRILRRTIVDHHRARARDAARTEAAGELAEVARSEQPSAVSPCPCTLRLLSDMRPAYAEIVQRIDLNGEAAHVVAESLGITPANLHVRLHRARHTLRTKVEARCGVSSIHACLDCTCDPTHRCRDGAL